MTDHATVRRLDLPWDRPPLSQNDRHHWAAAARKRKMIREAVIRLALAEKLPAADALAVTLYWAPVIRRNRDEDNPTPTTKACVDGLVKAGIVVDDHAGIVTHRGVRIVDPEPGQTTGKVWLELDYHPETGGGV